MKKELRPYYGIKIEQGQDFKLRKKLGFQGLVVSLNNYLRFSFLQKN
jgi:hypothetical protein